MRENLEKIVRELSEIHDHYANEVWNEENDDFAAVIPQAVKLGQLYAAIRILELERDPHPVGAL